MPAQDPAELFDLCTDRGEPLGRAKARALVHRDGDWHRSLHVWIVLRDEHDAPLLLFQRRSIAKDTWPGAIDVAVTGHFRAGETAVEALREADEEVGLPLAPGDVTRIGTRRRVHAAPPVLDREVQEIYLAITARPLASLRPQPDEVSALIALPLAAARALLVGGASRADGWSLAAQNATVEPCSVTLDEFIPDSDGYYARALESLEAKLRGEVHSAWWIPSEV